VLSFDAGTRRNSGIVLIEAGPNRIRWGKDVVFIPHVQDLAKARPLGNANTPHVCGNGLEFLDRREHFVQGYGSQDRDVGVLALRRSGQVHCVDLLVNDSLSSRFEIRQGWILSPDAEDGRNNADPEADEPDRQSIRMDTTSTGGGEVLSAEIAEHGGGTHHRNGDPCAGWSPRHRVHRERQTGGRDQANDNAQSCPGCVGGLGVGRVGFMQLRLQSDACSDDASSKRPTTFQYPSDGEEHCRGTNGRQRPPERPCQREGTHRPRDLSGSAEARARGHDWRRRPRVLWGIGPLVR